ncbi:MAG: diacylglycerol/lipid kinase family protein [Planctomycetota bacterium]|jgi:diacylglycerol kinase family enzyme
MRRKFIINPYSGKTIAGDAIAALERFFTAKTGGFDYSVAGSRDAAVRMTRESLRAGIEQVVAVGGDGTVNAVANGFFEDGRPIRPQSSLAVANLGTGSDYFKSVATGPTAPDWRALVLDHTVVNMASAGMVAEVVSKKERGSRWLPPRLRYLMPTIGSLLSYRPRPVQLEIDGQCLDMEVLVVSVCKGVYAGRGMRFGGEVTLSDGLFDVTVFKPMKRLEMLMKLRKLYTGSFQGERAIQKSKARRVSLRAPSAMPVEFDGELGGTTDVELSVEPRSLRICFPKSPTTSPGS